MNTFLRYTTLAVTIVSATACVHDGSQDKGIDAAGRPSTGQPTIQPSSGELFPAHPSPQGSHSMRQSLDGDMMRGQ